MCYNLFIMKINKKIKKIAIISSSFLLVGVIFYTSVFARGQVDQSTTNEVNQLNKQIQDKRTQAEDLQKKQEALQEQIKVKQTETADLSNQVAFLDNRVAETQLQIDSIMINIESTDLEMKKLNLEIIDKQEQMQIERDHVGVVLKLLYKQDRASALEILLLNNSFSEFLNQAKYLEDMSSELSDSLHSLEKLKEELDTQKTSLAVKATELDKLKVDMDNKKTELAVEKDNKSYILVQTQSSEQEYQNLLQQAKQEQAKAAADIVAMEKEVRNKLSPQQDKKLEASASGFTWPVPKKTITTYFHDPDYPFRYIFEHPAIDIRAAQGTSIRAAASGYVARAKDAGMGYSYIMLVHADGLATVYGHVSKILVSEDQYVEQGQIIGLSGGLPGSPGAGPLTTGPHLHFEIRLNGIPVNPLEYLP